MTVGVNEQLLVEKLSNGKSRVTRSVGGKAGVGIGVGFNVTGTWNDKAYGGALTAGAGVAATFSDGEVYYADDDNEVSDLVSAHKEAVSKAVVEGSGPAGGVAVGAVDLAEHLFNVGHDFPPVDETYVEGGGAAELRAQATSGTASAQAVGSAQAVLGTRQGRDGTSTTYYQVSGDLNLGAGTWTSDPQTNEPSYAKAAFERRKEAIFEVERDAKGIITAVRVKSVEAAKTEATAAEGPGENESYTEAVAELPIRSATDQAIAQRYLNAAGLGAMGGFTDLPEGAKNFAPTVSPSEAMAAAREFGKATGQRGFVTNQTFDNSKSGAYGANFDARYLARVSGGAQVDMVDRASTGLTYWDGSRMVPQQGCGGR